MKVKAKLKNLRISPRKVRLSTDLIKGMNVDNALIQLSSTIKKSNVAIDKLLKSAIANAENNFNLDRGNLFVSDIQVGEGPILKRWMPRAHGRATPILKRTSIVFLTLEEKEEKKVEESVKTEKKEDINTEKKGTVKKKDKKKEDKKEVKKEEKKVKDNN